MKKLLITLLTTLVLSSCTNAQTDKNEVEKSKTETFSAKSGRLIKKEYVTVETIKEVEISVVHYTDMITAESLSALKLEYDVVGKYSTDTKVALLDADEVESLIKSIRMLQDKVLSSTPTNYTEVRYKSRGGFETGCFWSKENWLTYLKLERLDNDSYVFLKKDDFPALLALLERAKLVLK